MHGHDVHHLLARASCTPRKPYKKTILAEISEASSESVQEEGVSLPPAGVAAELICFWRLEGIVMTIRFKTSKGGLQGFQKQLLPERSGHQVFTQQRAGPSSRRLVYGLPAMGWSDGDSVTYFDTSGCYVYPVGCVNLSCMRFSRLRNTDQGTCRHSEQCKDHTSVMSCHPSIW